MISTIVELETNLNSQLTALANDIRKAESALISTKEGYLKVQGALEILDILKKRIEDDEAKASLALATD